LRRVFDVRSRRKTPACTGPIGVADRRALSVSNLKAALGRWRPRVSDATSPASRCSSADHLPEPGGLSGLIAKCAALAIAKSGISVQIDCPDLAMGRHIHTPI
jgi:5-methyltetrahydropteroyltriglutamate--homocysteine methyltransferase